MWTDQRMTPCWYVTQSWGVHDQRWVNALAGQGFIPHVISLVRDELDATSSRALIMAGSPDMPVLAGPLTTVTRHLLGIPNRLVGLSWGFDLVELHDSGEHPDWLEILDHLVVDSPVTRGIAVGAGVDPDRITEIPWGTDLSVFHPGGLRADLENLHIPPGYSTVLSLRAHEPLYRIHDLVDAWPAVLDKRPDSVLLIGNTGTVTEELRERALHAGIDQHVRFLGLINEEDLAPLLRAVDAYVSTSPIDGTSVTLLQAMACGAPVIVADIPGNQAWVEPDVSGHLYRAGDAEDLAAMIIHTLSLPADVTQKLSRAARVQVLERADWNENSSLLRHALAPPL